MYAAERLCNVAIPANRQMSAEGLLKFLCRNVLPFDGVVLRVKQCGRMIVPMNLVKCIVAEDALFARVPLIDDCSDEAGLWRFFNLRKALLGAVFAFRPTRALAQCKMRRADGGLLRCFCRGNVHRCGEMILRTGHDSLAAKLEIRADCAENHVRCTSCDQSQEGNKEEFHGVRPFPGKSPVWRSVANR